MPNIGPMELIIVLVIALIVLGPKRLPDAGKSLGRGIREFKGSISGENKDDDEPRSVSSPRSSRSRSSPSPSPSPSGSASPEAALRLRHFLVTVGTCPTALLTVLGS